MRGLIAKRVLIILSVLAGLILTSSAMAGGIPKWVAKVPDDEEYIYFVGIKTGVPALEDGKRSAINQAVTELTEHFEMRTKTRYYEKKTELETRLLDEIDSKSGDTRLNGVLLKDWYFEKSDKGFDVYVLVRYPKAELEKERQRAQKIQAEKASSVKRLLKKGMNAWRKGEATAASLAFADALKEANDVDDVGLHKEALGSLRDLLQGVEIEAVSGESQKAEVFRALKEPLIAKVFIRLGGSEIPLKGIPVLFNVSHESKGDIVYTDEKGFASYQGLKVKAQSDPFIVTASLEPSGFLPQGIVPKPDRETVDSYIEALGQKRAVFTLNPVVVKKNMRVSVSITAGNSDDEFIVREAVSAGLADAGYEVVAAIGDDSGVDVVVTGGVRSRKGSGNMGWTYSSHADGFIKAVERSTGKVLAQKNLTAVGFGETEALAEVNAFRKLGIEITEQLMERIIEGGD